MNRPLPRDPQALNTTPREIDETIAQLYQQAESDPALTPAQYAQTLNEIHEVLRTALQEN